MSASIPPGFERCTNCREFNGKTAARYLSWGLPPDPLEADSSDSELWDRLRDLKSQVAATMDPDKIVSVTCLCHGPLCRRCGVVHVHKPGSNSYDLETNTIEHWPGFFGMIPCAACRAGIAPEDSSN